MGPASVLLGVTPRDMVRLSCGVTCSMALWRTRGRQYACDTRDDISGHARRSKGTMSVHRDKDVTSHAQGCRFERARLHMAQSVWGGVF